MHNVPCSLWSAGTAVFILTVGEVHIKVNQDQGLGGPEWTFLVFLNEAMPKGTNCCPIEVVLGERAYSRSE